MPTARAGRPVRRIAGPRGGRAAARSQPARPGQPGPARPPAAEAAQGGRAGTARPAGRLSQDRASQSLGQETGPAVAAPGRARSRPAAPATGRGGRARARLAATALARPGIGDEPTHRSGGPASGRRSPAGSMRLRRRVPSMPSRRRSACLVRLPYSRSTCTIPGAGTRPRPSGAVSGQVQDAAAALDAARLRSRRPPRPRAVGWPRARRRRPPGSDSRSDRHGHASSTNTRRSQARSASARRGRGRAGQVAGGMESVRDQGHRGDQGDRRVALAQGAQDVSGPPGRRPARRSGCRRSRSAARPRAPRAIPSAGNAPLRSFSSARAASAAVTASSAPACSSVMVIGVPLPRDGAAVPDRGGPAAAGRRR